MYPQKKMNLNEAMDSALCGTLHTFSGFNFHNPYLPQVLNLTWYGQANSAIRIRMG